MSISDGYSQSTKSFLFKEMSIFSCVTSGESERSDLGMTLSNPCRWSKVQRVPVVKGQPCLHSSVRRLLGFPMSEVFHPRVSYSHRQNQ